MRQESNNKDCRFVPKLNGMDFILSLVFYEMNVSELMRRRKGLSGGSFATDKEFADANYFVWKTQLTTL